MMSIRRCRPSRVDGSPAAMKAALVLLCLAVLAGCTPAQCDPNRADLFTGIGCETSGSYAARTTTLRNVAAAAQENELEQQAAAGRASAEEASAAHALQRRREQLAVLDGRLRAIQRELDAARRRQGVDQSALQRAQARLAQLRAQRAQVTPHSDDSQLRALEAPTRALNEQLQREGL